MATLFVRCDPARHAAYNAAARTAALPAAEWARQQLDAAAGVEPPDDQEPACPDPTARPPQTRSSPNGNG
jgi:hypothetical protein